MTLLRLLPYTQERCQCFRCRRHFVWIALPALNTFLAGRELCPECLRDAAAATSSAGGAP